jgi:hypothetical protein
VIVGHENSHRPTRGPSLSAGFHAVVSNLPGLGSPRQRRRRGSVPPQPLEAEPLGG